MHVFSVCYMYLYGFLSYYLCYTCILPPPPLPNNGALNTLHVLSMFYLHYVYALPVLSSLSALLGPVTHLSPSPVTVIWSETLNLQTSCLPFDSAACN